jgi:hypothetical protein
MPGENQGGKALNWIACNNELKKEKENLRVTSPLRQEYKF